MLASSSVYILLMCCLIGSCVAWLPRLRSNYRVPSRLDYAGTDFDAMDKDKVTLSTSNDGPVLKVVDRESNCTVHLVGVSHGSPASSELVSRVMQEVNPDSVVVELCEDRFVSISLDAAIRPRMNSTLESIYDEKTQIIKEMKGKKNLALTDANGEIPMLTRMRSAWQFAKQQGPVGGIFVVLGLTVSELQKYTRVSNGKKGGSSSSTVEVVGGTVCDEFVTAMKEAEQLNIPVVLGDAPQNDTLNSIKRVLSPELFDPVRVAEGAMFLAFSAFGVGARGSYEALASTIDNKALEESEWVSIPKTYAQSSAMLKSLGPFFALATLTASLGYLPELADTLGWSASSVNAAADTMSSVATEVASASVWEASRESIGQIAASAMSAELPAWVSTTTDVLADIFSFLLLVRMGKLIGTDRDKIIAGKVREAARKSPNKDIVVVIGMLHCNGVGRWLLSGQDPLEFERVNGVR